MNPEEFTVLFKLLNGWLQLVALEYGGHELDISFAAPHTQTAVSGNSIVTKNKQKVHPNLSCYLPLNMVHQTEPRISAVTKCITALNCGVSLKDSTGKTVDPDGFRLKPLSAWRTKIRPGDTEPIEHYLASGVCNVACEFCYERGTPKELRTPRQRVGLSELHTRLKYYDPIKGYSLFDIFHQYYDAFSHPHCMAILRKVRKRSEGILDLITNGRTLTRNVVDDLETLLPLQLTISLNSADPKKRKVIMRDKTPEVAVRSLALLAERDIPFGIVIVPWPPLIDELDIEQTIEFVDKFHPNFVSVSLPGYTDFLPQVPEELTEEFHRRIISAIRNLRKKYKTPLLTQPRMAEANWWNEEHERPIVLGSMPQTAAREAGLCYGDIIKFINGIKVKWAYDAHRFIELSELYGNDEIEVTIRRDEKTLRYKLTIDEQARKKGRMFGLIIGHGLRPESLSPIIDSAKDGLTIWILSSRWMASSVSRMIAVLLNVKVVPENILIKTVPNRYFGGNIALGDLLTTSDFELFLKDELSRASQPDKIFIPESPFSDWGKDLRGHDCDSLKRMFTCKIEFLQCNRILV